MRAFRTLWQRLKKLLLHRETIKKRATNESRPLGSDFAYLIELGYLHKKRLLRDPEISKVEVALVGRHLVITAYKDSGISENRS